MNLKYIDIFSGEMPFKITIFDGNLNYLETIGSLRPDKVGKN